VITVVGLQFGALLAGAVITETIFSWPGLGTLLIQAIQTRDYPLVQGCVLVVSLSYVIVNLCTDMLYVLVDPRIQYSGRNARWRSGQGTDPPAMSGRAWRWMKMKKSVSLFPTDSGGCFQERGAAGKGRGPSFAGMAILSVWLLAALLAPWFVPWNPMKTNLPEALAPPDRAHIFGQDALGRDVFSRVVYGARVSVTVGGGTVAVSLAVGIFLGFLAGYYGGMLDEGIMRGVDIVLAFPGILLAIALTAVLGPSLRNVILALCATGWVGYTRIVRVQVLAMRNAEFIQAARSLGVSSGRMLWRHILPNILAPLIVEATFGIAGAVLGEAGLSFLGLGTQPPQPSWGSMLNEGRQFLFVAPHMTLAPGLAIMTTVLGLNFLGDGLRDRLDVKRETG
jgi:peptide/nickel transport system permease protein